MFNFFQSITGGGQGTGPVDAEEILLYTLAGQSNAVSRAHAADLTDATLKQVNEGVQLWQPLAGEFQDVNPGVNTLATPGDFGVEVPLGKRLSDAFAKPVYFIKHGVGATPLAYTASKPNWNPAQGELYTELNTRRKLAENYLKSRGKQPVHKAFIWIQGEEDGTNQAWANAYYANLTSFAAKVRTDWGVPDLPFIIALNGLTDPAQPYDTIIQQAQQQFMADEQAAGRKSALIDTTAYPLQDFVHYNAQGIVMMGNDMFEELKTL